MSANPATDKTETCWVSDGLCVPYDPDEQNPDELRDELVTNITKKKTEGNDADDPAHLDPTPDDTRSPQPIDDEGWAQLTYDDLAKCIARNDRKQGVVGAALYLASVPYSEAYSREIRSQQRVSIGRRNEYRDGVLIVVDKALICDEVGIPDERPRGFGADDAYGAEAPCTVDTGVKPGARKLGQWTPKEIKDTAIRMLSAQADGDAHGAVAVHPVTAWTVLQSATVDGLQVRRGSRAQGRTTTDFEEGTNVLAVFLPEDETPQLFSTAYYWVHIYGADDTPAAPGERR